MRTSFTLCLGVLVIAAAVSLPTSSAAETNAAPVRIGVYDSRLLAYAHFWTEEHQRKLQEMAKAAKEAKTAGDLTRVRELETQLKKEQDGNHLQVFSTAPVDNVLSTMQDRVAEIQRTVGVVRLVSRWDEKTLNEEKRAQRVDVTDLLLREFKLGAKQKKVVEDLRHKKPLPLPKAQRLLQEGKL